MMGPVRRVSSFQRITFAQRVITSQPLNGTTIQVNTPTHITGLLEFASGAIGTLIMTFDVKGSQLPRIEVYGSQATLSVPDPNTFAGPVRIRRIRDEDWRDMPLTHGYTQRHRSLGLADMAIAIRSGRPHRANGELAYHVLDIMQAFHDSSVQGKHVELTSTCRRPAPLPLSLAEGELDT
jgi:predicted dehydrogenase